MSYIITIALLSFFDITLTYLILFLDRYKGVLDIRMEKGILARLIMRGNPTPRNYLLGCSISIPMFIITALIFRDLGIFFCGALVMVNLSHYFSIVYRYENWNNKKYWNSLRKSQGLDKST